MNYSTYVQQIATLAVIPPTDPNFTSIIPEMINYAELRIQRDLNLFAGQTVNTSYSCTVNSQTVEVENADFITIQSVSISPASGMHTPLLPVTKEYLQYVYPVNSTTGKPQYFSMDSTNIVTTTGGGANANGLPSFTIRLGPIPDSAYPLTINGTLHTKPLNGTDNTSTWISTYVPDLFIMASMVYISGYQRNFGRASDDPQMAVSYESQYQALLKSAIVEEARKRFEAAGWTSMAPPVVATPGR